MKPSRRSSFARRDSNLALLSAILAGAVIAFALLLLVVQRVDPETGTRLRGATADALSPIISVVRAPIEGVKRLGSFMRDHFNVVDRNRALEAEVKKARADSARAAQLEMDLERMEALIEMRRPERRVVAGAVASAVSADAGRRYAIISAGLSQGVRARMPVIAAEGLAGRVVDVGQQAARIMLLTDVESRVPVKVLRTGWTGLAVGNGGTLLEFQFDIASGTDSIREGDRLVTSGDGGLFPPGIPVAVIINTKSSPPMARAMANPTGLGRVMVEAPWLAPLVVVAAEPALSEADKVVSVPPPATPAAAASTPPARPAVAGPAAARP